MNIFDFSIVCERVPLSICPALGMTDAKCFARNVNIGSWLIFQPGKYYIRLRGNCLHCLSDVATVAIDIGAIIMTLIMVYHIKSKYTAVGTGIFGCIIRYLQICLGRKEMVLFFYYYLADVILELLLVSNIIPSSSSIYKVKNC